MNRLNKYLETVTDLWVSLIKLCSQSLNGLSDESAPALLNFWTYRGGGKTTFLHHVAKALSAPEVEIIGPWDVLGSKFEDLMSEILMAVSESSKAKKVVLLDNIDVLLRQAGGKAFFDFERQLILTLLGRNDVLVITTSQIPITQWREYDVRIHQKNHQISALSEQDVEKIAKTFSLDSRSLYKQSLGYPQLLAWLLEESAISEKAWSQRIIDYFLKDLPEDIRELAVVASLLPIFDVAVLRDVLPAQKAGKDESMYADYIDRIRELIGIGLVRWDMHLGAYRFSNSIVRRLLARSFGILNPERFREVHQGAAAYYKAESRRAGYLHYVFVSALYHLAYHLQFTEGDLIVGDRCQKWVENHINQWMGTNWEAVQEAWLDGGGDVMVKQELQVLLGPENYTEITRILEEAKQTMEVLA